MLNAQQLSPTRKAYILCVSQNIVGVDESPNVVRNAQTSILWCLPDEHAELEVSVVDENRIGGERKLQYS